MLELSLATMQSYISNLFELLMHVTLHIMPGVKVMDNFFHKVQVLKDRFLAVTFLKVLP